ncbi:MAG TPA: glycosyltransferase, partial [Chryseosolibacter sp.]
MISLFKNPAWIDSRLLAYTGLEDVPSWLLHEIKSGLQKFQDPNPLVSIVIPVLNEEFTIVRTLHSLSRNQTAFPAEIIVINNNSTDRTQEVLDFLKVK